MECAARIGGWALLVENIATLVASPGSRLDEPEWIERIVCGAGAGLLLDLHNLYAEAIDFRRRSAFAPLPNAAPEGHRRTPQWRAMGRRAKRGASSARRTSARHTCRGIRAAVRTRPPRSAAADGHYRARRAVSADCPSSRTARQRQSGVGYRLKSRRMSSPALEGFLVRLYTEEATLAELLRRPVEIARAAGLSDAEVLALEDADHAALVMAARSFRAKRQSEEPPRASTETQTQDTPPLWPDLTQGCPVQHWDNVGSSGANHDAAVGTPCPDLFRASTSWSPRSLSATKT